MVLVARRINRRLLKRQLRPGDLNPRKVAERLRRLLRKPPRPYRERWGGLLQDTAAILAKLVDLSRGQIEEILERRGRAHAGIKAGSATNGAKVLKSAAKS